jgi:hypothetical protein
METKKTKLKRIITNAKLQIFHGGLGFMVYLPFLVHFNLMIFDKYDMKKFHHYFMVKRGDTC